MVKFIHINRFVKLLKPKHGPVVNPFLYLPDSIISIYMFTKFQSTFIDL